MGYKRLKVAMGANHGMSSACGSKHCPSQDLFFAPVSGKFGYACLAGSFAYIPKFLIPPLGGGAKRNGHGAINALLLNSF